MAEFPNRRSWRNAGQEGEEFQEEAVWGFRTRGTAQNNSFQSGNNNQRHSVPIDIPDWVKMLMRWNHHGRNSTVDGIQGTNDNANYNDLVDDNENTDEELLPPHELIARRYAPGNSRVVASSMFHGVGRTLKGRDLRDVRNAILTSTGFLES
ncbi:OLC1v1015733C1 [Oldenlandia corymbosa var. corymbosa]|uniref:OLC1v1015733C1 n=1 Tax=Oldenlandia corymbosa var. corymbosa TaxID=529605 RepID=A0AAV1E6T9_OLDCO|nr:OLC1v1015733C1 [Oldenlandia corymbosa var. corymbosa]